MFEKGLNMPFILGDPSASLAGDIRAETPSSFVDIDMPLSNVQSPDASFEPIREKSKAPSRRVRAVDSLEAEDVSEHAWLLVDNQAVDIFPPQMEPGQSEQQGSSSVAAG